MKELSLSLKLSGVPALREERDARDCPMGTLRALRSLTYATESSFWMNEHRQAGRKLNGKIRSTRGGKYVRGRNKEANKQTDKQQESFEPVDARMRRADTVS